MVSFVLRSVATTFLIGVFCLQDFVRQVVSVLYLDRVATSELSYEYCIYSLASFSGDLSSMTAPPFILSPVSLTEFPGT